MNEQQVLQAIKNQIVNGTEASAIQILKDYKAS
jgi:hypothetical protein